MVLWKVARLYKTFGCSITVPHRFSSTTRRIDKLLIANRGEIACRVIRTARRLGVKTVSVYSSADKNAMHVQMADEAFLIGPPSSQESYLRADKILDVVKKSQCQAVHPGYGFLSENAEFADQCREQGIIFVGPPASAIRDMGIKSTSKKIMKEANVPIIEGYHGDDQSNETLKREAARIGYPIMIKAVRGGGGKGMRIAQSESDFMEALESARSEAQKSFGDSVVLLERFIGEPRHVEVQVFADSYGDAVHLFERDCSVQRRHQKIIEEAPAPGLSAELRSELGAAAVRAAKAVGYVGAGTVEFILDRHSHSFHFMEMNTRLQVEHPVTEMITGTDLVEWQIKIASGERLPLTQSDIRLNGHAFESRIYAEDPAGGFLPGAGPLKHLTTPQVSDDVRVETGVRQGDEVSVHYDPMIAKLVVWGKDRDEALMKMKSNLVHYNIAGLETNVNFLISLCKHKEFAAGNVHTNFIRDYHDSLFPQEKIDDEQKIQAAVALSLLESEAGDIGESNSPFVLESNFRVNHFHQRTVKLFFKDKEFNAMLKMLGRNKYSVSLDDGETWHSVEGEIGTGGSLKCSINGFVTNAKLYHDGKTLALFNDDGKLEFKLPQTKFSTDDGDSVLGFGNVALAPMPGILDKILVKIGDSVKKGEPVAVLIAMKMEFIVRAHKDLKVSDILHKVGDNVQKDTVLVQFETTE
uniref:Methylcrotonoyl-CoA carboxylase subunit alpha, mitochondrial n=1 Tax=Photinus pyralis TaxID=7054 RepID=A0A1Y1NLJ1_PHOPY